MSNTNKLLDLSVLKNLPELNAVNLSAEQALQSMIPNNFGDIISASVVTDGINITLLNGEDGNNVVHIPSHIYSPDSSNYVYPRFCLQVSSFSREKVDYENSNFLINVLQLTYMSIYHRLQSYSQHNVHYAGLLKDDIERIVSYGEYFNSNSVNSKLKSRNSVAILSPFKSTRNSDGSQNITWRTRYGAGAGKEDSIENQIPLGQMVDHSYVRLDKVLLRSLFRDLDIQPGSESMSSESKKFIVSDHNKRFYSAAGFGGVRKRNPNDPNKVTTAIRSIYPAKSNIPARIKSFTIADSYSFVDPSPSVFAEDYVQDGTSPNTIMNAFVIFDHIEEDSGRLLCGEIEASSDFASTIIYKEESISDSFGEVLVEKGGEYYPETKDSPIVLGKDLEGQNIAMYNFHSIEVKDIIENHIHGTTEMILLCKRTIDTSRIFSHTGLKGVTKPKPNLGTASISMNGVDHEVCVDLVVGMNAVKAKQNTILLAQAAFRHVIEESQDPIRSLDPKFINDYVKDFGKFEWTDEFGETKYRYGGIVQVSVNELGYMYNNIKPQSFSAEAGRYLHFGGHDELYKNIYEQGVPVEIQKLALECEKILKDDSAYFASHDKLPVYTPKQLRDLEIFDLGEDVCKEVNTIIPYNSKQLDPEYNKGWYLDLRDSNNPSNDRGVIRMPSAELMLFFTNRRPNGDISYPQMLRNSSEIIEHCLKKNPEGSTYEYNLGYISGPTNAKKSSNPNARVRNTAKTKYMQNLERMYCSGKKSLRSRLIKPKILGVGMKQMVDHMIPKNHVVIFDNYTYQTLRREAYADQIENGDTSSIDNNVDFKSLIVRNPVIWAMQVQSVTVWNKEHFKNYLKSQFDMDLKDYLDTKRCANVLFLNPEDAIIQQSDVDGDLMPLFVPKGSYCQDLLGKFEFIKGYEKDGYMGVSNVLPEEVQWIKDYRASEFESDEDLNIDKGYQLYDVPHRDNVDGSPSFADYFINTIIAKGDVGLSTNNNWSISLLLELIDYKASQPGGIQIHGDFKDRTKFELLELTEKDRKWIPFVYSRLIQDLVVRGIKHNADGSSGFTAFYLDNIYKVKYKGDVHNVLSETAKIPSDVIRKLLVIASWASRGSLADVQSFFREFNGGSIVKPVEEFEEIVNNTYYGKMVKPIFLVNKHMQHWKANGSQLSTEPMDCGIKDPESSEENWGFTDTGFNMGENKYEPSSNPAIGGFNIDNMLFGESNGSSENPEDKKSANESDDLLETDGYKIPDSAEDFLSGLNFS